MSTSLTKRFSQQQMKNFAAEIIKKIANSTKEKEYFLSPFKHLIIDDFLPLELAKNCLDDFPDPKEENWDIANDKDIEIKQRSTWKSEFDIPEGIIDAVRLFNASDMLYALAELFEIPKLVPDPYFTGGGLNITMPGGLLDVHVDGNYHDATGLNRRMNVILYLNPNWQKGWGGEFGIYDENGDKCVKKVEPLFNRLVAFDTHDKSYHGLPDPLNFPAGEYRKSIILYYYTKAPRDAVNDIIKDPHRALWKKYDFTDKDRNLTRKYY